MRAHSERIILILAVLGILLSLYALPLHYSSNGSRLCNISESFDCDKVNKSQWSEFLGIPVAGLGAVAYLVLFLLVLRRKAVQRSLAFTSRDTWTYILLLAIAMLLFQGYLTLAEVLWIHAYCIVCLASQAVTLVIAIMTFSLWRSAR
jgi:uncharacterized membrane protein